MPPKNYSKQLDALRELYDRVKEKEAGIPDSAYTEAGVKVNARLKDIEKEISATKKKVSVELKKVTNAEIEKEMEQLAKEANMTVEEFKEALAAKDRNGGEGGDFATKHTAQKKERAAQRQLKETRRQVDRGDYDMQVDFV